MLRWFRRFLPRALSATAVRGQVGEALAADFLRRERGFKIVVRNWRSARDRRAEIDLVCRDREVLVFVEVKARAADALVPGYYGVTPRKKRALRRACMSYLAQLGRRAQSFRLDVVEVSLPAATAPAGTEPVVRHFENIPLFPKHYEG